MWCQSTEPPYTEPHVQWYYPKDTWFTGFVLGEQMPGESLETTYERIKNEARVEAASSVKTSIQKDMLSSNSSEMVQTGTIFDERVTEVFHSKTHISVDLQIPGLKVDVWQDPKTKEIGAFAFVQRREVERKTEKQITALLSKLEMILQNTEQLIASGQKMEARKTAEKALPMFAEIEQHQKLLLSISDDMEALQLGETQTLRSQFIEQLAALKNGIYICLRCNANLPDGSRYTALKGEITGALSPMGCSFTDNEDEADWFVTVDATSREYNASQSGEYTSYVVYVETDISVRKVTTGQTVYEDRLSEKGCHTHNYEQAARDGYKKISPKISTVIKQQIQK